MVLEFLLLASSPCGPMSHISESRLVAHFWRTDHLLPAMIPLMPLLARLCSKHVKYGSIGWWWNLFVRWRWSISHAFLDWACFPPNLSFCRLRKSATTQKSHNILFLHYRLCWDAKNASGLHTFDFHTLGPAITYPPTVMCKGWWTAALLLMGPVCAMERMRARCDLQTEPAVWSPTGVQTVPLPTTSPQLWGDQRTCVAAEGVVGMGERFGTNFWWGEVMISVSRIIRWGI